MTPTSGPFNVVNPNYLVCTNCIVRRDCKSLITLNAELLEALKAAFVAIQTLEESALGMGEAVNMDGLPYQYPFRNELLHNIHAAIAKAEAEVKP